MLVNFHKHYKTTKQRGGVIPNINFTGSTEKDAELFVAFEQAIKKFWI